MTRTIVIGGGLTGLADGRSRLEEGPDRLDGPGLRRKRDSDGVALDRTVHRSRLQRQLARLAQLFCRVFYERVEVQGLEHLPAQGPVLVFANHANALADAIVLVSVFPGLLRPMARSGLFLVPVLSISGVTQV